MSQLELYVDTEDTSSGQADYYIHPGDWRRNIPVDVSFSDFKTENGILLPHTAVETPQ